MISVVMPAFNCESTIDLAIKSTLSQLSTCDELIVVNDGSMDATVSIIKKTKDPRLKLINKKSNSGIVESLNEAIEFAYGDFIARMDADDICLPDRFVNQLKFIDESGSDLIGSRAFTFGAKVNGVIGLALNCCEVNFSLLNRNTIIHPTVFARSYVLKKMLYDKNFSHAEDYDLWVRCLAEGYKIASSDHVAIKYRVHKGQISSLKREEMSTVAEKIRKRHLFALTSALGVDVENGCETLNLDLYNRILRKMNKLYPNCKISPAISNREFLHLSLADPKSLKRLPRLSLLRNLVSDGDFLLKISSGLAMMYCITRVDKFRIYSRRFL